MRIENEFRYMFVCAHSRCLHGRSLLAACLYIAQKAMPDAISQQAVTLCQNQDQNQNLIIACAIEWPTLHFSRFKILDCVMMLHMQCMCIILPE